MRITKEQIRKFRIDNGATGMFEKAKVVSSAEEIIQNTYFFTNNQSAKELSEMYEKLAVLAKVNFKKYSRNRDRYHMEIASFIKKNNLYREWIDLSYIINLDIENNAVLNMVSSELMDTWAVLRWQEDDYIYGLTTSGELLTTPSYYGNWDYELHEARMLMDKKTITKRDRERIDQIMSSDYMSVERNEQIYSIILFQMMPFINERTKSIMPTEWIDGANGNVVQRLMVRQWKPTSFYVEQLRNRKFMLDRNGVRIHLRNANGIKEVAMKEDLTRDNKVVLLFRITMHDNRSTAGYYNINDEHFFTGYRHSSQKDVHRSLESLVLELYTYITCGLDIDIKRIYALEEVEDISEIDNYKPTKLYAQFVHDDEPTGTRVSGGHRKPQRPHERTHALRKLAKGMTASEEAIRRAREMGIELQEGYTYVRKYRVGGSESVRQEIKQ